MGRAPFYGIFGEETAHRLQRCHLLAPHSVVAAAAGGAVAAAGAASGPAETAAAGERQAAGMLEPTAAGGTGGGGGGGCGGVGVGVGVGIGGGGRLAQSRRGLSSSALVVGVGGDWRPSAVAVEDGVGPPTPPYHRLHSGLQHCHHCRCRCRCCCRYCCCCCCCCCCCPENRCLSSLLKSREWSWCLWRRVLVAARTRPWGELKFLLHCRNAPTTS